ncbi:MAG TPA: argininosuccinate synthase [bacterium]|nr:argininosuccinate synthase [bacterium]
MNKKVLVAFSGGLDTSYAVVWLKEQGWEVHTCTVNTGGFTVTQLEEIVRRSTELGAVSHVCVDAQDSFLRDYVSYLLKAGYLRNNTYPLISSLPRQLEAMHVVTVAKQLQAQAIAHGSTGAGNDQVRFESVFYALAPQMEIIAPYRDQGLTRQAEAEYLQKHGVSFSAVKKEYSLNTSCLGTTICGKEFNGSQGLCPGDVYPTVKPLADTPDEPESIEIQFEQGCAVRLNGKKLDALSLFSDVSALAAQHGIGKGTHLGETILGIKGRLGFEAPAYMTILPALQELQKLTLTAKQLFWLQTLGTVYGDMLHEAQFFDPLVEDIKTFLDAMHQQVSGTVQVQLFKGNVIVAGATSPYSLMDAKVAVYAEGNSAWSGADARGFCKLYGMTGRIAMSREL